MTPDSRPTPSPATNPILFRIRPCTAYPAGFPDPHTIADAAGIEVIAAVLPGRSEVLVNGSELWYRWDPDQRVRGTRIFRGLAKMIVGRNACSEDEILALAGRLAAPPSLLSQLGLSETVRQQPWATEAFLRWWCDMCV